MRLLIAASKVDFGPRLDEAIEQVRRLIRPPLVLVAPTAIPWDRVIQSEGSWDGAYRWAARTHAACCLVETEAGALGRGTYQLAQEFLRVGKRVVVLRDGRLLRVMEVVESGANDWKTDYGVAIVEDRGERFRQETPF